jgi:hypothetical protein
MSFLKETLVEGLFTVVDPANNLFLGHWVSINGEYRLQFCEIFSKISE